MTNKYQELYIKSSYDIPNPVQRTAAYDLFMHVSLVLLTPEEQLVDVPQNCVCHRRRGSYILII